MHSPARLRSTGSLVLVSHDRALLRTVCDEFLIVADGGVVPFDGDLDDYMAWLNARRSAQAAANAAAGNACERFSGAGSLSKGAYARAKAYPTPSTR